MTMTRATGLMKAPVYTERGSPDVLSLRVGAGLALQAAATKDACKTAGYRHDYRLSSGPSQATASP
jgi:hypothetical protein